jgi:hypothetical protein
VVKSMLRSAGACAIHGVYDGDGNRVSKTVAGVKTTYVADTQNPTGYAQVVQESFSGATGNNYELTHTYVYGWSASANAATSCRTTTVYMPTATTSTTSTAQYAL